jgi:multiple sugar transport system ATP-binding protein
MRMIAGLEDVTNADIPIDGERRNDLAPKNRDIAMVFQSDALYPDVNIYASIRFPPEVRKADPATHDARAVEMVELTGFLHRKPAKLSGPQRRRVALAIVHEPNLFLMDEPLSNLDAKLRVSTRAQIKHLSHALGVTTIYVTHDQIEAMTLADRVVAMNKGVVQQVGTPTDIYDHPANTFVAGFIGTPAMNLLDGQIRNGVFECGAVRIAGLNAPDAAVTLGFRAEDTQPAETGELTAPIYSLELLGDATMATVRAGGTLVSVKCPKDFRAAIGAPFAARIPAAACHLFDATTHERIHP